MAGAEAINPVDVQEDAAVCTGSTVAAGGNVIRDAADGLSSLR